MIPYSFKKAERVPDGTTNLQVRKQRPNGAISSDELADPVRHDAQEIIGSTGRRGHADKRQPNLPSFVEITVVLT